MEDFPIEQYPDIPNWSENFALAGFDPALGVDVFLHLGRWRKDISLWRQLLVISLPDESFIVHRAIGNALATKRGPGGPNLAMEVIEDGHRLRWRFLGGARRFTGAFLRNSLPLDGPMERLELDLEFRSDLPFWHLGAGGAKASGFAGHGHTEQIGKTVGEISFGAERLGFNSYVNRDHSRGPRVMKDEMVRHIWFHGIFENGARFYAYEAQETDEDKATFSEACVVIDDTPHKATLRAGNRLPKIDAMRHIFEPVPFTLDYEGGSLAGRVSSFPTSSYQQYTAPSESYLGAREIGTVPARRLMEQSALYELDDGTSGYGHMERTVPGRLLADEELTD